MQRLWSWNQFLKVSNYIKMCSTRFPGAQISQARKLEWIAISFPKGSLWHRNWIRISYISRWILSLSHQGSPDVSYWMVTSTQFSALCFYLLFLFFFFSFIFISWRLITLQYCSGFCHTLTWISHGFTRITHPDTPSHLPLHPIPLGLPSARGPSTCLMHPAWAGDLFHPW